MKRSLTIMALISSLVMAGCATQDDFLNSRQDMAMQTAVSRGRFDMNRPNANGMVLSREVTQPPFRIHGNLKPGVFLLRGFRLSASDASCREEETRT